MLNQLSERLRLTQGYTANKKVTWNLKLLHLPSTYNLIRMVSEKPVANIAQLSRGVGNQQLPKPWPGGTSFILTHNPSVLFSYGNFPVVLGFS